MRTTCTRLFGSRVLAAGFQPAVSRQPIRSYMTHIALVVGFICLRRSQMIGWNIPSWEVHSELMRSSPQRPGREVHVLMAFGIWMYLVLALYPVAVSVCHCSPVRVPGAVVVFC